jgi:large subunit ribosomal protein L24
MQKIKKGDEVIVLTGKDKGKRGKVSVVFPKLRKLKVEGIQMIKKTIKPNPQLNRQGGIVDKEARLDISNVAIFNPITKKADGIRIKVKDDGKKVRHFKSNDELVEIG